MTKRIHKARCHPDKSNHYMGKCKECWEWLRDPDATCPHNDRKQDKFGRCSSCMSRFYYLRREAGKGDYFGTPRINKGIPVKYGPEYEAKRWAKKKLEQLKREQNNKCAICNIEDEKGLCLDHDHSCCPLGRSCEKCIRAALCHGCNMRLGQLESPLVEKSLKYLKLHKKRLQE